MAKKYIITYYPPECIDEFGQLNYDDNRQITRLTLHSAKVNAIRLADVDVNGEVHIDEQTYSDQYKEWEWTENSWLVYADGSMVNS